MGMSIATEIGVGGLLQASEGPLLRGSRVLHPRVLCEVLALCTSGL